MIDKITAELEELEKASLKYSRSSLSENSKKGYRSDFNDFAHWCKRSNRVALPATANSVALYLTKMSSHLKVSSLRRRVTAISKTHEAAGHQSPTLDAKVKSVLRGIIRTNWERQKHAQPTLIEHVKMIATTLSASDAKSIRDKALLLIGFAGGFRRSELVALNIEDLALAKEGIVITINKSKTDQTGKSRPVAIMYGNDPITCPVKALTALLELLGTSSGALFRGINRWGQLSPSRLTDQSVRLILMETLKKAGISSKGFSGHSLRAGFVTVASINGVSERDIQRTTGHSSLEVLRRYIRDAEIFRDNASKRLGL